MKKFAKGFWGMLKDPGDRKMLLLAGVGIAVIALPFIGVYELVTAPPLETWSWQEIAVTCSFIIGAAIVFK